MVEQLSSLINGLGRRLQECHWYRAARLTYAVASFLNRRMSSAWYNRGLIAKFEARWNDSVVFNRRATELDPTNQAAWWNLGIAATALADRPTARHAWSGFGIEVPAGAGPLDLNLGAAPIRLSPQTNGEVVWTRRIDPARAQILSVPTPDCGRAHLDIVLHDGEPRGKRLWKGRELSVFNELQLLEASGFSTFRAQLTIPSPEDFADLEKIASESGAAVDDWSSMVLLCAKCSEGSPHEHDPGELEWQSNRHIGVAARSEAEAREFIAEWLRDKPDRQLQALERVLNRSDDGLTLG